MSNFFKKRKLEEVKTLPSKKAATSQFNDSQLKVIELIEAKKSVFFTGSAGTGKTTLLHYIIEHTLPNLYPTENKKPAFYKTATSGLAASHIGGMTLHGFAGVGFAKESAQELSQKIVKMKTVRERWRNCRALIIDEISMLDATLFDKLEYIARTIKQVNKPFGGIQLIITGDFFQLPPVGSDVQYCFESSLWKQMFNKNIVVLNNVYRQKDDTFAKVLNKIREGVVDEQVNNFFSTKNETKYDGKIKPTILESKCVDVDTENNRELKLLNTESIIYKMEESTINKDQTTILKRECPAKERLELKIGAQVLLIKNLDVSNELVNGSRGVIVEFKNREDGDDTIKYPVVEFKDGTSRMIKPESWERKIDGATVARVTQIPLILAWCLTIHKCQGMSLDCAKIYLSTIFEYGQAYVALSRVRSKEGLYLDKWEPKKIKANEKVVKFYKSLL